MSPAERTRLRQAGVVAEVSGIFLDAEGGVTCREETARMICMDADELGRVAEVIALPYGAAKAPAVWAAVRSGLVTTLVTHTAMAETLLAGEPISAARGSGREVH